jgi:hypothetical protein
MKLSRLFAVFATIAIGFRACPAAEKKKEEPIEIPYSHVYYWQDYTLTKDAPASADGRFRLKRVRKNGEVELLYSPTPDVAEIIIVKAAPKKLKGSERPPTVVVEEFDAPKQLAKIRELRMR